MEGFGFVSSLHAATLDSRGSNTLLLKPTKRQSRSSSSGSISGKTKNFINRSRSFLSTGSPSSPTGTRASLSLSSLRGSEHGHQKRANSMSLDSQSVFASSTSSRFASGDYNRSSQTSRSSPQHSGPNQLPSPCLHRAELQCNAHLDPTWLSTLVDNGYISQPESTPPSSPPRCKDIDEEFDSGLEPSRASSMLDHDLVSLSSHEGSPQLPLPDLSPLLSHSIAQQLAHSIDEDSSHTSWSTDCQRQLPSDLIPQLGRKQHRFRPHTAGA